MKLPNLLGTAAIRSHSWLQGQNVIEKIINYKINMKYTQENTKKLVNKDLRIQLTKKSKMDISCKLLEANKFGLKCQMQEFKIYINYEDITSIEEYDTQIIDE